MNRKSFWVAFACSTILGGWQANAAFAQDAEQDIQTKAPGEFSFHGVVRQGISAALDPLHDDADYGPSQFTVQAIGTYKPNESLKFVGDFWLRGDWAYDLNDGGPTVDGLKDFTDGAGGFHKSFPYNLSKNGNGSIADLANAYGDDGDDAKYLSDFNDDIIREVSVTYQDPSGAWGLKAGKFQRGWGQADGIRLLDVVYPIDLRQRAIFTDTEDLRLPAWTVAFDGKLDKLGMGAPFRALGLTNPSIELLFLPEVRHNAFVINNPTPSSRTNGGFFGVPFPDLVDGGTGLGMPFLGANLTDKDFDTFGGEKFAGRLKFGVAGGEATINGYSGYQEMPIVEFTGANLIIGNSLSDEGAAGVTVVPLGLNAALGAYHGGYLPLLALVGGGAPTSTICDNIVAVGAACSINANFDLNYRHRKNLVGMSFIRDMVELPLGPKGVTPVVRMEMSYEFDKPFNVGVYDPGIPGTTVASGSSALIAPASAVQQRDQWSVMVGFDYNLWLSFWKSQQASLFMTTQFFNIHTEDPDNLLYQAPYAFEFVDEDHNYFTQTWSLPLRNQTITLDGLLVYDIDKQGVAYRQRAELATFGGRLKPRLEYGYFDGDNERGLLGYFQNSDYLEFSLAYQF